MRFAQSALRDAAVARKLLLIGGETHLASFATFEMADQQLKAVTQTVVVDQNLFQQLCVQQQPGAHLLSARSDSASSSSESPVTSW